MTALTVVETAHAVASGQATATQMVREALARIEATEPQVHAFTQVLADEALAEAAAVDADPARRTGPLAGVPVAIKAELDVAGVVTTHGGRGNSLPAERDCELVRRLRAAGAVVVGITHMPEFGQFPFTETLRYGVTANPAAPGRTAGGSSGGSAAAVASGMVPVAIGSDGGGSIRIPSSACGLVGLKATRGLVTTHPWPTSWRGLCSSGPLTRTALDNALVHQVIRGTMPVDTYRFDGAPDQLVEAAATDPSPLRIGLALRPHAPGTRLDPQVRDVVLAFADELASLGHTVVRLDERRAALPFPGLAYVPLMYGGLRDTASHVQHPELVEPRSATSVTRARAFDNAVVTRLADVGRERLRRRVDGVLGQVDVVLTPTLACLPPTSPVMTTMGATAASRAALPLIAYTCLFNVTGHPALSVPAGRAADGTPVGAQLVARWGRDDLLLQLAAQWERSRA